jgi:exosortase
MTPKGSQCTGFRALPWLARFNAVGVCMGIAAFAALLWQQWLHDDNLTHGVFLPILAGILMVEGRRDPSPRFTSAGPGPILCGALLILTSLASLAAAIAYATALGWSHAMAEFLLSVSLVSALGAALLAFADRRVRFLPLNWATVVAVILWLFASPTPPGTYARLASFLQARVTEGVVRVLHGAGIAAFQDGNVIELARTTVGVSEACSGVRSLISCTVAGLFLSGLLLRRPVHRALIIVLSPAIGLAMNFVRSLLLTLLANAGVNIELHWHDLTGASILVGTTILVSALALWLHRREAAPPETPAEVPKASSGTSPLQGIVAAALLLVAAAAVAFSTGGRSAGAPTAIPVDLEALFPAPPRGWTASTTPDMDQYSDVLHTHALMERVYSDGVSPGGIRLSFYLAYWQPGQASVSLVDAHTPDACWPGTGWNAEPVPDERTILDVGGRQLAPAECRLFSHDRFSTHVWFWHLYGGRPLVFVDPYSATRLLKIAWRFGFGRPEDQLFVRVSSNKPWQEVASQPPVRQLFESLKPLGL